MQVLTPSGYVDVSTLRVGDSLCAFDADTGAPRINYLERLERWQPFMDGLRSRDCADDSEIGPQFSPWTFYLVNGTLTLFGEQSIWRNGTNVCHVRDLVIGDTIYDDADNPIVIIGIGETAAPDIWYRFDVSGDHSYIADGLSFHNASRFAVNAGAVDWTWDLSTATHWASASNGAGGQSAPGSADAVTFDANSGGHVVTPSYGGTGTFQSITCGAFTGTINWSTNNNNVTLSAFGGFSGTGTGVRTLTLGTIAITLSANGASWSMATTTNLTFSGASATIAFTGNASRTFDGGGLTYGTVTVANGSGGIFNIGGTSNVISTLTVAASNYLALPVTNTYTTLTLSGTSAAPVTFASNTVGVQRGVTVTTLTAAWCAFRDVAFTGTGLTATNSFNLGDNSGITITAPSAGGGGISRARAQGGF